MEKIFKIGLKVIITIILLGLAGWVSYLFKDKDGLPVFAILAVATLPLYLFVKFCLLKKTN